MNEEYNPYNSVPSGDMQPPQEFQPQRPFSQQYSNSAQTQYDQQYAAPVQQYRPVGYQQTFTNQPVQQKKTTSGAARAFGMTSFIIGCFVLLITSMIYFNFRSSVSAKFGYALGYGIVFSVPALIFGVISLMKKTDKKIFPILGISFAAVLLLCAFITYFFMVNAGL